MKRTHIFNEQAAVLSDEIYSNSIIPSTRGEMWRRVELHGDTQVLGGVFGESLLLGEGNVYVRDASYLRDSLRIQTRDGARAWFHSAVAVGKTVDNLRTGARTRFSSDLHATAVNLANSIVYGNVICEEAILEDCVVLGGVLAKRSLTVGNCVLGTFETDTFEQLSTIGILQPFALCASITARKGRIFNLMPFRRADGKKASVYEIVDDDIREKTIEDAEGRPKQWLVFSVGKRVFDLSSYLQATADNLKQIEQSVGIEGDDLAATEQHLKTLDDFFFAFVDSHFDLEYEIPYSSFMDAALRGIPTPPLQAADVPPHSPAPLPTLSEILRYEVREFSTSTILGHLTTDDYSQLTTFIESTPGQPGHYRIDADILELIALSDSARSLADQLRAIFAAVNPPSGELDLQLIPVFAQGDH